MSLNITSILVFLEVHSVEKQCSSLSEVILVFDKKTIYQVLSFFLYRSCFTPSLFIVGLLVVQPHLPDLRILRVCRVNLIPILRVGLRGVHTRATRDKRHATAIFSLQLKYLRLFTFQRPLQATSDKEICDATEPLNAQKNRCLVRGAGGYRHMKLKMSITFLIIDRFKKF